VAVLNNNYLLKKVKEIRGSAFLTRKDSTGSSRSGTAGNHDPGNRSDNR